MAEDVTVKEVHAMLERHLGNRSDLGIWNTVAMRVMRPSSPFEPESVRSLQRWFVLVSIVSLAAIGAFAYFNFWN